MTDRGVERSRGEGPEDIHEKTRGKRLTLHSTERKKCTQGGEEETMLKKRKAAAAGESFAEFRASMPEKGVVGEKKKISSG